MRHPPSPPLGRTLTALVALLVAAPAAPVLSGLGTRLAAQSRAELQGVWAAERYHMAAGAEYEVQGRIFFGERDWQVLFFVVDDADEVRRGSAEGGTYTLEGGELVFAHLFNLSFGEEMPGLPAAELRMVSRPPGEAPLEPTNLAIEGDRLTLYFPSGNRMTFRRR